MNDFTYTFIIQWHGDYDLRRNRSQLVPIEVRIGPTYVKQRISSYNCVFNTYSKFTENTRLRLVFSIQNLTRLVTSFLWLQNSIDQAVSENKCFIIHRATAAKGYLVYRNTAQVVKLKVHVLQLLNV